MIQALYIFGGLVLFSALNAFIFRIYFDKKNFQEEHHTKSAKLSRFSMNILNLTVVAIGLSSWFVDNTSQQKPLIISLFTAISAYFIFIHFKIMKKLLTEDFIIGVGFNILVFFGLLALIHLA